MVQTPIAIRLADTLLGYRVPHSPTVPGIHIGWDSNGSPVTCELEFNDGEESLVLGTVTTTERERVNLNVNGGLGFQAYRCSLLLTGSGIAPILLYQAKIGRYLGGDAAEFRQLLAEARDSREQSMPSALPGLQQFCSDYLHGLL